MCPRFIPLIIVLLLGGSISRAQSLSDDDSEVCETQWQCVPPSGIEPIPGPPTEQNPQEQPIASECPSGDGPAAAPQPPLYESLRYDEDYSYLRDASRRTDPWDSIKFIPLSDDNEAYLSLGGETRQRYEFYHNPEFGAGPQDAQGNNDWMLQRYMLHGDLHLHENIRLFGQLKSGLENGEIGGPRPDVDEDRFDANQAFADLRFPLAEEITWRVGRQEFEYGSGRLISPRETPNLRRSFDAARAIVKVGDWNVDALWSRPVRNRIDVFDDDPNPQKSLWGFYGVHPVAVLPAGHADVYYLGSQNEQGTFYQGTGYELRHTIGTRIWGEPTPWEYNFEFIWQFGKFGNGEIQAWAVASDTHYNLSDWPTKPRLGLTADITSGDRNPDDPDLQTYNPLFPTGAYFNLADLGGPQNFIQVHPRADFHLSETLKASVDWGWFWRTSLEDGTYSIGGSPTRPGEPSRARFLSSSPAATLTWNATRHVTVLTSYVHASAGRFFEETPPGEDVDYATTWVTYKF
jgi:hypothetical protein